MCRLLIQWKLLAAIDQSLERHARVIFTAKSYLVKISMAQETSSVLDGRTTHKFGRAIACSPPRICQTNKPESSPPPNALFNAQLRLLAAAGMLTELVMTPPAASSRWLYNNSKPAHCISWLPHACPICQNSENACGIEGISNIIGVERNKLCTCPSFPLIDETNH